ncbi:MAG: hypothetical protein ACLFP8_08080 [Alphaproteobacteria bacterium]
MQILECYRIVTFVPLSHIDAVVDALCESDLLSYGHYKDVLWFSSAGTGQFTPVEGADPTQGEIGKRERVEEVRLEFSILRNDKNLEHLIDRVLVPAHPWEEPAIAIYETRETRSEV